MTIALTKGRIGLNSERPNRGEYFGARYLSTDTAVTSEWTPGGWIDVEFGATMRCEPNLRTGDPSLWKRWIFTVDADAPDSALTFEFGRWRSRIIGGTGTQSNRREGWQIPGVPATPYHRVRARFSSKPPADGTIEHGIMLGARSDSDGKIRGAIVWDFSFGLLLGGVWEADADGTDFVAAQANYKDRDTASALVRASNVVTATVPTGALTRWHVGDAITVDADDNTYDGVWVITEVTNATTIKWAQVASDDASGGTAVIHLNGANTLESVARTFAFTDAARASNVVTPAGVNTFHPFQDGDWVTVDAADNTYDGRFPIINVNPLSGQPTWSQAVANDAAAGAGTVSKSSPYWVEAELLPNSILRARAWPDVGIGGSAARLPGGPPPWESCWAQTWDLSTVTGVTAPSGPGYPLIMAAHHSSNSPVTHDNISWELVSNPT